MWKRVAYGILTLLLLHFVLQQTSNWAASRIGEFQSAEVRRAAQSAMDSAATIEQAQNWLQLAGFESTPPTFDFSAASSTRSTSTGTTNHLVVSGEQQVVPKNWFLEPRWIHVEFLFDPEGRFQRVETTVWPWSMNISSETSTKSS